MRSSTHFFLPAGIGFLVFFGCVIICPIFSLIGFVPAPLNVMQKQKKVQVMSPVHVPNLVVPFLIVFLEIEQSNGVLRDT